MGGYIAAWAFRIFARNRSERLRILRGDDIAFYMYGARKRVSARIALRNEPLANDKACCERSSFHRCTASGRGMCMAGTRHRQDGTDGQQKDVHMQSAADTG
ncbi:hypothetical protein BFJ70_g7025 [Fusarium oxysporum]|uniref:Uncharacterized protein n=1 Tax=Fusarium oxysporum f. sp. cepae TaxID=396571 RepID=A0A3L6NUJ1_FUSOX|nr:hypothetical protein BFJ65_g5017 [Fusarium oxysporum f. sp. cepae]RKK51100.1 hypothetical protein BFJ67_g6115 [Fusarium oxysporum f. sp. cepae]RKK53833.1 hypothetical protein BFJ66_g4854 [Fusarium oxysporum f. sp. cepae]RKK91675.1 hypothetical protein BFJ71_g10712 [Fusarium oxysporum]RKL37454.1 hypothetical protein BFJ70_g7025 [Fusarium oxysporum]